MFMNKTGRKMRYPYAKMAVFGLAAAGVASIVSKSKKFIKDKKDSITHMMNGMK
ncbi:MAG: hypothetical protein J6K85_00235 [Clostridia bacterium]|nr:hypothetical protein [Clostridia bacterium]